MASTLWKIRYAGVTKTADAWGATGLVLARRNMEVDLLTFRMPRADIFENCPFAYGATLDLYRGETRYFTGTVQPAAATGENSESFFVTVAGPWLQLQRITYQTWRSVQNEDFSGLVGRYSPLVVLGQDPWGQKITTDLQITDIANFALSQASGIFVISAIDDGVTPPITDARNISCAAAIRRQLEWTPDAAAWFNYASTPAPTLIIQRRAAMSTASIDLNDETLLGFSSLRRRDDMVPAGVVFTFNTLALDVLTSEYKPVMTDQIAGASAGPGVIFAQFTLANQGTDQAEEIPAGLAAAYYASLLTPYWEGSLQHVDESGECTGFARPGQLLNLLHGNAAWATMAAVINTVSEDLDRGVTSIELGLPPTLGADDFRDLMAKARNTQPASDDSRKNHNGTEGVPEENGGLGHAPGVPSDDRAGNSNAGTTSGPMGSANSTFRAKFCIDGQEVEKNVMGA